jgi:TRAP transporter 4TM/12TM fusion protein
MNQGDHWLKKTTHILILSLGIYDLLALGGVFDFLNIYVPIITHRGLNLAFLIALTYLIFKSRFLFLDIFLLIAGLIPALYVTILPDRIMAVTENIDLVNTNEMILFLALVLSVMEAGRRSGGLALLVVSLCFFSAVFFGDYYPGPFYARTLSLQTVTANMYLSLGSSSLFGMVADVGSTILISFMLFGGFLEVSGAGAFFIKLGLSAAGKYRGGPAKVSIFSSALMGSISGSGVANVVTTGTFTIPLMKKVGFRSYFAGAVEAVASNGGQIAPPVMGAVAFLIAQMLGISYWEVCVAATMPAVLYYLALFFMIDFEAAKEKLQGIPEQEVPKLSHTLKEGWYFFLPILALVFLIAQQIFSVQRSCIFACVFLVVMSFFGGKEKRFTLKKFLYGIERGVRGMVMIAGSLYIAGIIIAAVQMTGIGINFTRLLAQFAGQSIFLMLVMAAISSMVLGMGLSSVPCYIICALLVGPPLVASGIDPLAAHLFFFYWGILSFITPPVAIAALAAAGIAGANFWKTGFTAMRLGVVSYIVPFFFVYQPALMLKGSFALVFMSIITSIGGCYMLSAGMIGYFLKPVPLLIRFVVIFGGLCLIYPGLKSDIAGLTAFGILLISNLLSLRSEREAVPVVR